MLPLLVSKKLCFSIIDEEELGGFRLAAMEDVFWFDVSMDNASDNILEDMILAMHPFQDIYHAESDLEGTLEIKRLDLLDIV